MKTIRAKITLWFSTLFLVLVVIVMALLYLVGRYTVYISTQDRLRALVEANVDELEYIAPDERWEAERGDVYLPWGEGTLEIDDDFQSYANGVYVSLYRGEEFLHGEDPVGLNPSILPFSDSELRKTKYAGNEYYVYDLRVPTQNLESIRIRGLINTDEDVPVLLRVSMYILVALPVLAVLTICGGNLLARRALRPLYEISAQANHISSGSDLTRRIEIGCESEETRLLADSFNTMFERLHSSFESEKQFTSAASHELRTPVAVLLAECEYALGEDDPAEWRESLEVIHRQGAKMSRTIEDMLTFARIERGVCNIKWGEVLLDELTAEVCQEQQALRKKEIALHAELDANMRVRGDRGLLERLIRNLISNAYQYGREPGNIWVRVCKQEDHVVLSVRDDGIGIREEDLPKIWNRFYRAENARGAGESTGLGLSMVRQIASLHGARVEAISKIDEGSTFLIVF